MVSLSLSILEQPARYHRFRYETEIAGGKLGGLLYGRSGSKSCVRLTLRGADPAVCRTVIVIGGTISPDGYPHPFYMHGDSCESGAFQWRRDITAADVGKEIEICLEKVSLVCVPHGGSSGKLQKAIKRREEIQFNPFNKKISEIRYTSRNVRELRLVFQAYYIDLNGKTVPCKGAIAQTEVISDIKFQTKLEIEEAHPSEGYVHAKQQEMWLYFKDALPHTDASQYNAFLDFEGEQIVQCKVLWLKKQLMSITIPSLRGSALPEGSATADRIECSIRIVDLKSDVAAEHEFYLSRSCTLCNSLTEPAHKRSRCSPSNGGQPETEIAVISLPASDSVEVKTEN
ncbi:hypothetical protein BOX15_Mlig020664g4 [Macrostomum lignano]|uniref:Uncharacterized protein n=2 Tax=Macrostomum lignano TaxID=282301 RepID=A0A267H1Q9_9PLAT|nr:hypothetical protein BOX15_Mlig020664g4 [Macrostomum lignano]